MKLVAIGDLHGRTDWKLIMAQNSDADEFIFIGDYFDSWDFTAMEQLKNFDELCAAKRKSEKPFILLIGNHDYENYMPWGTGCSGKQHVAYHNIRIALEQNMDLLQMAYCVDDVLFTHAGVAKQWLNNHYPDRGQDYSAHTIESEVNDLWRYKPSSFAFDGVDGYGDDVYQTSIWIRPRSLMIGNRDIRNELIQIVGHTSQKQIDIEGYSTGGRYYFIDTMAHGEYLVYENGIFKTGKI